MEGFNPAIGCTSGCKSCRTYILPSKLPLPRRDALIDAIGITDNPCERPARCGPCCEPRPKFRRPKELPDCNLDCFREEQRNAKSREACEEYQKFVKNCCPPPPDCCCQDEEDQIIVQEVSCRTNIIAGFFNPDDNKSPEQILKEQCDQTYLSCGPNLPMYPCRAAITYPPLAYTTAANEMNKCKSRFICQGTKYCDPEFQRQQLEELQEKECAKKMEAERLEMEEEFRRKYYNPSSIQHPCVANQRLSLTPFCNCGCDMR